MSERWVGVRAWGGRGSVGSTFYLLGSWTERNDDYFFLSLLALSLLFQLLSFIFFQRWFSLL